MKTSLRIRIITMSLFALAAFGFVSKTFAISMNYTKIMMKYESGKTVTADINKDGTFSFPGPITAGTYTFSLISSGPRQTTSLDGTVNTVATSPAGRKGWDPVSKITITCSIVSSADHQTGILVGKRQHSDISISKRSDAASGKMATSSSPTNEIGSAKIDEDCNGITGKIVIWDQKGKVMAEDSWQQ